MSGRSTLDASGRSGGLAYVPALDGLRAICVLGVLGFHAGFDAMRGGFLGVSTFFTLSGFLVTSILFAGLDAQRRRGVKRPRVAIVDFARRRLRRLVPASVVTLVLVVLVAPFLIGPEAQGRLGGDVVASLLYVVNWRFVQGEYAYALLFSDPSLLQHYWSLAIEGQLYVVLPIAAVIATRTADARRSFGLIVLAALGAGTLLAFALGADPTTHDRIYYGTDTRAPELLAGALLALVLHRHPLEIDRSHGRALDFMGWIAAALLLAAFSRVELASDWLHRGGFTAFALVSAVIVMACIQGGSLSRVLAWRPLVFIGEISYGVYLFHWPIYLALDVWLVDPAPAVKLAFGGAVTLAIAALSHAFIETPIRRGRGALGRAPLLATALAVVTVTGLVALRLPADAVLTELRGREEPTQMDAPRAPGAARLAVFGDSVGYSFVGGLVPWIRTQDAGWFVPGWNPIGCGLLMPDLLRELEAEGEDITIWTRPRRDGFSSRRECMDVPRHIDERITSSKPDLAIVVSGTWDLIGLPGPGRVPQRVGHPRIDERLRRVMDAYIAHLTGGGAEVAWTTLPPFVRSDKYPMTQAAADVARARYNDLVRELPGRWPGRVHVVDLAAYVERWPEGPLDASLREDGLHYTADGAHALLDMGLGAELLELAVDARNRAAR